MNNATLISKEKTEVKFSFEVSPETLETGLAFAYNKNKNQISLPGFRKGKVPRKLIEALRRGEVSYDFVEVMACPTGCIGGAGQPESFLEDKKKRSSGLYTADKSALVKRSDENPVVTKLYEDGVLKDRARELLHVHYKAPAASQS